MNDDGDLDWVGTSLTSGQAFIVERVEPPSSLVLTVSLPDGFTGQVSKLLVSLADEIPVTGIPVAIPVTIHNVDSDGDGHRDVDQILTPSRDLVLAVDDVGITGDYHVVVTLYMEGGGVFQPVPGIDYMASSPKLTFGEGTAEAVLELLLISSPGRPADFDSDGDVDADDFLLWQTGFGMTSGATLADGDGDGDGDVDGDDFLLWQQNFGSGPAAPISADFDSDSDVDGDDFLAWQGGFGRFPSGGATLADGDANGDGYVDGDDFLIWQSNFGSGSNGSGAVIAVQSNAEQRPGAVDNVLAGYRKPATRVVFRQPIDDVREHRLALAFVNRDDATWGRERVAESPQWRAAAEHGWEGFGGRGSGIRVKERPVRLESGQHPDERSIQESLYQAIYERDILPFDGLARNRFRADEQQSEGLKDRDRALETLLVERDTL